MPDAQQTVQLAGSNVNETFPAITKEYHSAGLRFPALDGIRGIAILLVLVFHATLYFQWDSAIGKSIGTIANVGWLGVDLFFALSGFLITGILLDTKSTPHYFRNFYGRRTLRIFPLYYAVLIIIFGIVPFFKNFDTKGLQNIWNNQGWFWTYLTNLGFVHNRHPFGDSDWLSINHLWSLAIEEQFYLIWPAVVFMLSRKSLKILCVCLAVGALCLRIWLWSLGMRPGALYFPTPCRIDALAMGALIAAIMREPGGIQLSLVLAKRALVVVFPLILLLCAWRQGLRFSDRPVLVFGITLFSILAAAGVVLAVNAPVRSPIFRIFSQSWLVMFGKYSYAIYLFHGIIKPIFDVYLPVESLTQWLGAVWLGKMVYVALFIMFSLGLAILSWHTFEKHFLKLKRFVEYSPQPGKK